MECLGKIIRGRVVTAAVAAVLTMLMVGNAIYRMQRVAVMLTYQPLKCPCWRNMSDISTQEVSSCSPFANFRGSNQNVIAYSLYGKAAGPYFEGIAMNAELAPTFYAGWVMRVYTNLDIHNTLKDAVCNITCSYEHVDFCDVHHLPVLGNISGKVGSIWRFMVLGDKSVDRFLIRDLDSLLGQRERDAVNDWITSNLTFHVMRDHPFHATAILAGMWGGWNRNITFGGWMRQKILNKTQHHGKQEDQTILRTVLWPEMLRTKDVIVHDSYLCGNFPLSRPFPTQRRNITDFVGAAVLRSNRTLTGHCPARCRPEKHKDWLWC